MRQTSSTTSQLVLDVAWLPAAGAVDLLEQEIAVRYPAIAPLVEVRMAPPTDLIVDATELALLDADGTRHVLATSTAGRTPPYRAALTATFDHAQAARVREALEGGTAGLLMVDLRYALNVAVKATARIGGSVAALIAERAAQFTGGFGDTEAMTILDAALSAGALKAEVVLAPLGELGRALADDVMSTARQSAARVIAAGFKPPPAADTRPLRTAHRRQHEQPPGPRPEPDPQPESTINASASLDARVRVPPEHGPAPWLVATTDLGAWAAASRQSS